MFPCTTRPSLGPILQNFVRTLIGDAFIKRIVAHHHGRGAAACEAFYKFDGVFPVRRCLRSMGFMVEAEFVAKMLVQFAGASQRATERAANLDLSFAHGLAAEHWIERYQFKDVNGLEVELCCSPLDGLARDPAELVLDSVQHHERRAALLGVMAN